MICHNIGHPTAHSPSYFGVKTFSHKRLAFNFQVWGEYNPPIDLHLIFEKSSGKGGFKSEDVSETILSLQHKYTVRAPSKPALVLKLLLIINRGF